MSTAITAAASPASLRSMLPPAPAADAREAEVISQVEDAAVRVRDLLQRQDPAESANLAAVVAELKKGGITSAASMSVAATLEAARGASLASLQGGMLCGALDGLLMLCASIAVSDPACEVDASVRARCDLLLSGMDKAREVARDQWVGMPSDDLQLLAGYGKHQNLQTGDESRALVGKPPQEGAEWLMATFKAGYAIGLVDAAIMARGENPDPVA